MKTKLLLTTLFTFVFYLLSSQVPQGFNYQAIARDASGNPIINILMPVRITIQSDSLGGTICWIEEHSSVTTNGFGLFTLILGKGVRQTGSTVATFNDIDWKVTPKFIKTEINYNGWKNMGSSRLWSVPYSQISGGLYGSINKLTVKGDVISTDSTLFEVKNNTGQTIFAVYPEGVRIFVDDGIAKGVKGGFAIGGFGTAKAASQEYFRVTRDSTRVYVNPLAKGTKGGFAIGGFGAKGNLDNFLNLTTENYFIGHQSGSSNTTGLYNTFLGYQSGLSNTLGSNNCFMGKMSGKMNTKGTNNVFIGFESGYNNTGGDNSFQGSDNTFIGSNSGHENTSGWSNIFIGNGAGYKTNDGYRNIFLGVGAGYENIDGSDNIYFGNSAGQYNTSGYGNIFLGVTAGNHNQTGSENIFFGTWSGGFNTSGSNNICIGRQTGMQNNGSDNVYIGPMAGMYNTVGINNLFLGSLAGGTNSGGSGNVFLGYHAGYNETGSNKLYIANSEVDPPIIYGDFSSKRVGIGTTTPGYTLDVYGSVAGQGGFTSLSDKRFKKDIQPITGALSKVMALQGITFNWDRTTNPQLNVDDKNHIGFSAQDIEKVLPQVVNTATDIMQTKSVAYGDVVPVLVEAIKEQQQQIESTRQENTMLKSELQSLKERMEQIEAMLAKSGAK